jgi:hypothetical protein
MLLYFVSFDLLWVLLWLLLWVLFWLLFLLLVKVSFVPGQAGLVKQLV